MRLSVFLTLIFALLIWPASADEPAAGGTKPHGSVCTQQAEAAYVKLPPYTKASEYAKRLQAVLRPVWWETPADELSACGAKGDSQAHPEHPEIQGSERIRELVVTVHRDGAADDGGSAAPIGLILVVKSDQGIVVTERQVPIDDPHGDPESMEIVRNGADTLAIFDSHSGDLEVIFQEISVYKVDLGSGTIAPYPIFMTSNEANELHNSWPLSDDSRHPTELKGRDGKLVQKFIALSAMDCKQDDDDCDETLHKTSTETYTWNGSVYVSDGQTGDGSKPSASGRKTAQGGLAKLRQCLKSKFDSKTGTAPCDVGAYACESDNDLSFLNYKAGNMAQAQSYATRALDECKANPKELAAAQFNDRRTRSK